MTVWIPGNWARGPAWLGRPKRGRELDHARFQLVTPLLGVDAEGVDLGSPLASRSGHHRQQESDLLLWAHRGHRVIGSRVEAQSSLGAAPRSSRRGRSSCSRWRDSPASGRPPGRRTRDEEPWPPSRGCDPPSGPATVDRSARRELDQWSWDEVSILVGWNAREHASRRPDGFLTSTTLPKSDLKRTQPPWKADVVAGRRDVPPGDRYLNGERANLFGFSWVISSTTALDRSVARRSRHRSRGRTWRSPLVPSGGRSGGGRPPSR